MVPLLALPEGGEWIVILVIVVLLFGAKKLPELTKNAARAMKEFEKVRNGDDEETPAQVTAPPQAQTPQAPAQQAQAPAAPPQPAPAQPTDSQPARPTDADGGTAK
ncbi:twin-arginine translocase TatA/TatE family subunit [Kribbella sp. NPDC058693]|uniref:twin-arginine translocase TatA/TatE family subunit n=1 Tax=Kribbella sp. NPDC058693 TaxID=3346602 RepID=UPI00364664CF